MAEGNTTAFPSASSPARGTSTATVTRMSSSALPGTRTARAARAGPPVPRIGERARAERFLVRGGRPVRRELRRLGRHRRRCQRRRPFGRPRGRELPDNPDVDEGRAYLYLGSASGPASSAAWSAEGNQAVAAFGVSVASAGDVNGHGFSDVAVGAPLYDNGQAEEGRAYVYFGSASGLATSPAWTAGNQELAYFGRSVGTAGDVNGDGFADLIVGSHYFDNGEVDEGRAFVYLGSSSGLASTPAWTAEADQATARFGTTVATAGDVNGDGYSDVIVGAYLYDDGETDQGRAFLYLGGATGLATTANWTAQGDQAGASFGYSVASAGDINGDGFSDVVVGAPEYDGGQTDEGRALVYLGSASGPGSSPVWTAEVNQATAYYGWSVASAGDVNGDGFSDVVVGAYGFESGAGEGGRAYAYLGSATGLAAEPAWVGQAGRAGATFGISVASAGDVNGDGFSDVLVGARNFTNDLALEGSAYVYLGSRRESPRVRCGPSKGTSSWPTSADALRRPVTSTETAIRTSSSARINTTAANRTREGSSSTTATRDEGFRFDLASCRFSAPRSLPWGRVRTPTGSSWGSTDACHTVEAASICSSRSSPSARFSTDSISGIGGPGRTPVSEALRSAPRSSA